MCTLTYIPLEKGNFIFTTNRDESKNRRAIPPAIYKHGNNELLYARDIETSGTWMASNGKDTTVCLLNGAFERHERKLNYRLSRGLMVLDVFNYGDVREFVRNYNFEGIEPFTLIIISRKDALQLHEVRWDEHSIYYQVFPAELPRIWSSTTLYNLEIREERRQWFNEWLKKEEKKTQNSVFHFHRTGGKGDPRVDFIMNRNDKVLTISITSLLWEKERLHIIYEDLINKRKFTKQCGKEEFITSAKTIS